MAYGSILTLASSWRIQTQDPSNIFSTSSTEIRGDPAKRFTKQGFLGYLSDLSCELKDRWSFGSNNGYAQVIGKGLPAHKAYGQFNVLEELIDEIFSGEIKPFSKKAILAHIENWIKHARIEAETGDGGARIRAGGEVSILVKVAKDIKAKVM